MSSTNDDKVLETFPIKQTKKEHKSKKIQVQDTSHRRASRPIKRKNSLRRQKLANRKSAAATRKVDPLENPEPEVTSLFNEKSKLDIPYKVC